MESKDEDSETYDSPSLPSKIGQEFCDFIGVLQGNTTYMIKCFNTFHLKMYSFSIITCSQ
jgi:hypothetical protein